MEDAICHDVVTAGVKLLPEQLRSFGCSSDLFIITMGDTDDKIQVISARGLDK